MTDPAGPAGVRPGQLGGFSVRSAGVSRSALIVLLVAFNLRGALIALAPVMDQVRHDARLSAPAAGLLLTLPVLCFAAFYLWQRGSPAAGASSRSSP